jgi:hypothetical protein
MTASPSRDRLQRLGIANADMDALEKALGAGSQGYNFDQRCEALIDMALVELTEWIVGRRRFGTISESDGNRVLKLFLDIRDEVPTVEALANQLGIPESRAVSMLSRMRYGSGRRLRAKNCSTSSRVLTQKLAVAQNEGGRKTVTVELTCLECVKEAAWEVMMEPQLHAKGKKYAVAERPEYFDISKYGGTVVASVGTWEYIIAWLDEKAQELANG